VMMMNSNKMTAAAAVIRSLSPDMGSLSIPRFNRHAPFLSNARSEKSVAEKTYHLGGCRSIGFGGFDLPTAGFADTT
jgi:hypothetical protein